MFTVVFKNLDKSDLIKETVITRPQETIDRFPDLAGDRTRVKLRSKRARLLDHPEEVEAEDGL